MKTFTTYAEKKAKQILNLLQGYTKGIRITAILILLLMGVNSAWAYDVPAGYYVYFEKPDNWSQASLLLGHSSYSIGYSMTNISNTKLYYWKTDKWDGYTEYFFMQDKWGSEGNSPTHRNAYAGSNKTSVFKIEFKKYHLFTTAGSKSSHATDRKIAINRTQTIKVQLKDGSNWVDATVVPADLTASTYAMTDNSTAVSAASASLAKESTTVSATVDAAYSATVSLSCTNVLDGYVFDGWYDANGNKITSYTVSDAHTVYARFKENTYTVTVKNDGHGTTTPSGAQSNVGEVTGLSIKANPAANYEFVNWTITSGSGSFGSATSASTTFKPTSAATIQANFRSTATNSLTVVAGANIESVTGSTDPVTLGNIYNITATPKTGYTFSTWTANPAANATFGSATTANTTVTVNNGSVIVTASATENMSTLTTSNKYDAGDPGYAAPSATVSKIGIATTATVTATAAGEGYTFEGWTLNNCTRTDGGATNATTITIRSNGDSKAAEVVANYAEDLTSTYYVQGDNAGPFTEGWNANENTMMKKRSGESTSKDVYWELEVPAGKVTPSETQWEFKIYNSAGTSDNTKWLGWGTDNNYYWLTKENNNLALSTSGSNNIRFKPYLVGTYTFHVNYDNPSSPTLEVIWPTLNQICFYSEQTGGSGTDTYEWDNTSSTTWTKTISLSKGTHYFKVLENSEYLGNTGTMTRGNCSGWTMSSTTENCGITADVAGDYLFSYNTSTNKLTVTYPTAYKLTYESTYVGGTVSATAQSNTLQLLNTEVTFTATPKTGYRFIGWQDGNDNTISEANPYTHKMVSDISIKTDFVTNSEQVVYLKPTSKWKGDKPTFAVHVWNNGGDATAQDIPMTAIDCNGDYYTATIPAGFHSMVFYRKSTDGTTVWNKTADLVIPVNTTNCYTISSTSTPSEGSWSTYTPPTYEITLSPRIGGTITTDPVSPVEVNTEVTVTMTPSTGYAFRSGSIKIGTNEAIDITQTSSTHTICGPTEITAEFVTASEQIVYLKPTSKWNSDSPTFAVHVWNNSGDDGAQDIDMTPADCNGDYYMATIPPGFHSMVFYRKSTDGTDVWNKTADLDIPVNTTNNCYTISSTSTPSEGSWSTYTAPTYDITINAPESGTIKVTIGGVTTTVTSEAKTISNVALNAQMDVLFEPATGYKLGKAIIQIGNNEKASAAGTYTVCGPTEITAYFVTKEDQVVYLRPTDAWLADNARFAIWAFNRYAGTEASQWIELTTQETDYTGAFSGTIPAGHSHIQFVRMPSTGEFSFDIDLAQTINYSIPTDGTNNRFILGATVTTSGDDYGKYQGSWEANNTPIYGIPGDWQGNENWAADEYPLMGPDGLVTVNITQTNDTLGFKVYQYPYGSDNNSAQWLGNNGTMVRGNSTNWEMTTTSNNCGLGVDIADDYVFNFDIRTKQLTVTYPELPAPNAITASAERVFEESVLTWVAGNGTEANPYQLYIDETARFTVTPLTEVAGLTAYYRFGHYEEQTANSFDFTEINTKDTTLTVIAYYKNAMGSTSDTVTTQTPYIKGLTLPFYLMTDPSDEINIDRVDAGENILVQFRSDAAATVGLYLQINDSTETKLTDITNSISKDYTHDVDDNIKPCILHYIARSAATVHGRIFEATANVAIYKNVIIKVNDPEGWVKNAYMWRDGSDDVLTPWPGDPVLQHFGTWRVFSVKYPYYDRFIVNAGTEGAQQTVNWILPSDDTCYELLDPENNGSNLPEDVGKYGLQVANCPGNLIVGDLQDTTIYVSDQIVVIPSIALGLGYSTSDLTPSVTSSNTTAVTATMSGMNITIIGNAEGESTITVTYTLVTGETATKTFKVTVEKKTHITIQVKVPSQSGPESNRIGWIDSTKIYIRYWNDQEQGADIQMTYLTTLNDYLYLEAEVPLDEDGETNFHAFYEYINSESERWRQTDNIEKATEDGCYIVTTTGTQNSYNRGITYEGVRCLADEYQIRVLMLNGKTYTSNIVGTLSDTLSFFAPGKNETGYKAGAVMLYINDAMVATIDPAKFETSGVYTANLHDTDNDITNVAPYTGNYYIRTWGTDGDLNNQGWESAQSWTDEQKAERKFTYFVSREGEFYNHYWVQDMNSGGYDGKDVSACVANDYNDDLAGKLLQDKHTDEYGDIKIGTNVTINVRFGYDPRTNYFGRAVLKGSEYDNYLNIHCDNAYADKDCTKPLPYGTSNTENKMRDISNWVYQRDFYVPITNQIPSASVYLEAVSPNYTKTVIDHLLGYVTNEITGEATTTPIQRRVIGSGTTNGVYLMRIIYDFKTNRIITAWLPQGTVEIDQEKTINSDVLFVRNENEDVPQIQLSNLGKIKSLETMYFALELHRKEADAANRHEEQYWFTLPFDCVVGSISGVHGYMDIWGIQRYNGEKRAKIGWFIETPTFWEWLSPNDTLKAGEGYLLAFDKKNAPFEEIEVDKMDAEGNLIEGEKETISMMRLYFPSITSGYDLQQQSEQQLTVTYPDHTCTITYKDRYLQDSNWKVIGTTSYNNAGVTGYTQDTVPGYEEWKEGAPKFRYEYSYTFDENNVRTSYTYTPELGGEGAIYKSFFGYMVQFAGTITWQPIMSETVPEGIAARRYIPEGERTSYMTRLEIANAEGEKQDQTFVALDEEATTSFDQNKDLNKVLNSGKNNIYTLSEDIPFAGNTLPLEKITVPVGVRIDQSGEYTFRMPDGTDGISAILVDYQTGERTDMLLDEYTVTLNAGTCNDRFALILDPQRTATSVENINGESGEAANSNEATGAEKFIIDGKLIIRTADGIFDAQGHRL